MFARSLRSPILSTLKARAFTTGVVARQVPAGYKKLSDIKTADDLIGPGAQPGTVPTSLEQATGLERLELLGKMEGIDVFDQTPLDDTRIGTMADPIVIDSFDDYRYVGCSGSPAGSHPLMWLKPTVEREGRCWECGSVYKLNFIGNPDPHHHH